MGISNFSGKNYSSTRSKGINEYLKGALRWDDLDLRSQNMIVSSLLKKVKIIAIRIKNKLPLNIELDDLISAGSLGLIEGLKNFDPSYNVKLETYIENRIKGAILDELRKQDWLSRSFRKNLKLIEDILQKYEHEFSREPTIKELSNATGLREKEIETCLNLLKHNLLIDLDSVKHLLSSDEEKSSPNYLFEKQELKSLIAKGIKTLTKKEQLVISLYYVDELTMKEIAKVLSITEGRVSQLHSQAIKKLRKFLYSERMKD